MPPMGPSTSRARCEKVKTRKNPVPVILRFSGRSPSVVQKGDLWLVAQNIKLIEPRALWCRITTCISDRLRAARRCRNHVEEPPSAIAKKGPTTKRNTKQVARTGQEARVGINEQGSRGESGKRVLSERAAVVNVEGRHFLCLPCQLFFVAENRLVTHTRKKAPKPCLTV